MNNTIKMKKIIIVALLVVSISAFAQGNKERKNRSNKGNKEMKTPEERGEARLKVLTKKLDLDANQQVQMKRIIVEQTRKMEAMKSERMANLDDAISSNGEQKSTKIKREEENMVLENRIRTILSSTQYLKYKEFIEMNKDKSKGNTIRY